MKLHKVDTTQWTVREVEGEPWPGKDSDGDTCYENTHFVSERSAWDKLKAEVTAGARIAGRMVDTAKGQLATAEQEAGRMAQALLTVCDQLNARSMTPSAMSGALPEPDVTALCDYVDAAGQRHSMAYSVDAARELLAAEREQWRSALQQVSDSLAARLGTNAAEWPAVQAARALLDS